MDRESILSLAEAYQQISEWGIQDEDPNSGIGISNPNVKLEPGPKFPAANKYKDADRPPGWYIVKVGGKDEARYWPGGKNYGGASKDKGTGWKVDGPNPNGIGGGMGAAGDQRAADIRRAEADAQNQRNLRNVRDQLTNIPAASIAVPATIWGQGSVAAQNAWNRMQRGSEGLPSVRKNGTGDFVTPGEKYRAQQNGEWGSIVYDEKGKGTWTADARQNNVDGHMNFLKGLVGLNNPSGSGNGTPTGTGGDGGQSRNSGMSPEELKAAQDRINQQRRDNIEAGRANNNLPSDLKGTEAQQFQAADEFRQGAGTSSLPAAVQPEVRQAAAAQDARDAETPAETPAAPTNRDGSDVTQKGPNSAGLTPMQQWAKNFPHLAQRVKPGQAGYEDIKNMPEVRNAKQPTVGGIERRTPGPLNNQPLKTSNSQPTGSSLPNLSQKVAQVKNNTEKAFAKPDNQSRSIQPMGQIKMNSPKLNMNNAQNNVKKAFPSLPEETFYELMVHQGLAEDTSTAKVIAEHMSPEYRAYLEEDWAQKLSDFTRKTGKQAMDAIDGAWDGALGKKIGADRSPVARGLNSFTRNTSNLGKKLGAALTGGTPPSSSSTPAPKPESKPETKPESKPETKPETKAPTPKPEPKAQTPAKPKGDRAPKPSSSGTSRLDSALKWASDSKNKDAWMKEGFGGISDEALEAAAAANQKRDKERGMKIHDTEGVKALFKIKPGQASKKTKEERKPKA